MPDTYEKGTTKYTPHKTANCRAPSESGPVVICNHCGAATRRGSVKDGECPFCFRQIGGRR